VKRIFVFAGIYLWCL